MNRIKDQGRLTPTEDTQQAAIWKRLWRNYPHLRRKFWHVPNQGSNAIEGARLKSMGVLEGVWDLHSFFAGEYHVWEGKVGNNQLTRDRIDKKGRRHFGQKEWGEIMQQEGAHTHVFRSEDEFFQQLNTVLQRLGLPAEVLQNEK